MKKSLIGMLFGIVLLRGGTFGKSPELGKSFATSLEQRVQQSFYGTRELPSPTFLFTGEVPAGATNLVVDRKGEQQTGTFKIKTDNWSEFSLHFRVGYANLEYGKNHYKLTFRKGETLRGIGFLDITSTFQKKQFGDATLYLDEEKASLQKTPNDTRVHPTSQGYVVQYGNDFFVLTNPFSYDEEKGLLYEGRNLKTLTGSSLTYGDWYVNGKLIMKDVPVQYRDTSGENALTFDYTPPQDQMVVQRQDSEGCRYFYKAEGYQLSTKEKYVEVGIFKHRSSEDQGEGANILYQNKKLEVFPVVETGTDTFLLSLKYRYSLKEKEKWRTVVEDFIVKNQKSLHTEDSLCETATFSYQFDLDQEELVVKRDKNVGWKAETYTWHLNQLPIFYKTNS